MDGTSSNKNVWRFQWILFILNNEYLLRSCWNTLHMKTLVCAQIRKSIFFFLSLQARTEVLVLVRRQHRFFIIHGSTFLTRYFFGDVLFFFFFCFSSRFQLVCACVVVVSSCVHLYYTQRYSKSYTEKEWFSFFLWVALLIELPKWLILWMRR